MLYFDFSTINYLQKCSDVSGYIFQTDSKRSLLQICIEFSSEWRGGHTEFIPVYTFSSVKNLNSISGYNIDFKGRNGG
jgi:hypothetical protein